MKTGRHVERIKVLFFIDKWQTGGRQRVLQQMIDTIDKSKFETVLLIISDPDPSFPLPHSRTISIPRGRYRSYVLPLARIIRSERPDLISSHLGITMVPIVYLARALSML